MKKQFTQLLVVVISILTITSCNQSRTKISEEDLISSTTDTLNLLTDFNPINKNGEVNVVVEIPAGTREKWEVDKTDGKVKLEYIDSHPRIVNYIGYPGNYGMIPQTLLPKELGGDGDPLDVIVLGDPVERASVISCKLIGVLLLKDRGEQDDKLIAVQVGTSFYENLNDIDELQEKYNGVAEIIEFWFANYKGPGKMKAMGFDDKAAALKILESAIKAYKTSNTN